MIMPWKWHLEAQSRRTGSVSANEIGKADAQFKSLRET